MNNTYFQKAWDSFNLEEDYWSIVGFQDRDSFHVSAQQKLKLLQSIGFGFDSDILDVGCGTGIVPSAIYDEMKGTYYGCDISEKGIAYCRKKYAKDNFNFFVSGQTSICCPDNVKFDFIVFYSVFTHCTADEIKQLMSEAQKLLKPSGKIFADFFIGEKYNGEQRHISAISEKEFENSTALPCRVLYDSPFEQNINRRLVIFQNK